MNDFKFYIRDAEFDVQGIESVNELNSLIKAENEKIKKLK